MSTDDSGASSKPAAPTSEPPAAGGALTTTGPPPRASGTLAAAPQVNPPGQATQVPIQQMAVFGQFFQNQAKEIELRTAQLELSKKQLDQGHEFACQSLNVQANDRREERNHDHRQHRERYLFGGFVLLLLGTLVAYALHLGKDEFVREVAKFAILYAAGAVSGAGYMRIREKPAKDDDGDADSGEPNTKRR